MPTVQLLGSVGDPFAASTSTLVVSSDSAGPADDTIVLQQANGQAGTLQVIVNGQIEYSGLTAAFGNLVIDGGTGQDTVTFADAFSLAGSVTARASTVEFNSTLNVNGGVQVFGSDRVTVAAGATVAAPGGQIVLQSSADGTTVVSGSVDASDTTPGQVGGTVNVLGGTIELSTTAWLNVSGAGGGGTVHVGGDFHGQADLLTATRTYGVAGAQIRADALTQGSGGRVVVWSEQATSFAGSVMARGGAQGGDGGFIEVSSEGALGYRGYADTSAPHGARGTLLLDPYNILIQTGGSNPLPVGAGDSNNTTNMIIDPAALDTPSGVVLFANNDITIASAVNLATPHAEFALLAGRSIFIDANITTLNSPEIFYANLGSNSWGTNNAYRDSGTAVITMAPGTFVNNQTTANDSFASTAFYIDPGTGLTNFTSGNITLAQVSVGAGVFQAQNLGTTAGSGIVRASGPALITASTAGFVVSGSNGSIGNAAQPLVIAASNVKGIGSAGGVYLATMTDVTVGGGATIYSDADGSTITGISSTNGGAISLIPGFTGKMITVAEPISVSGAGDITLIGGSTSPSFALTINAAISTGGGKVTLEGNSGVHLSGSGNVSTGGGNLLINADENGFGNGLYQQDSSVTLSTAGGNVSITTGIFGGDPITINGTISSDTGNITLAPSLITTIGIGTGSTGTFNLSTLELARLLCSGTVTIGIASNQAVNFTSPDLSSTTYNLTVQGGSMSLGNLTLSSGKTLQLFANGTITNSVSGTNITIAGGTGNVLLSASGAIGSQTNPVTVNAGTVAAQSTGGDVFLANTGNLSIGTVGAMVGVSAASGQQIGLAAGNSITLGASLSAPGGNVTLVAGAVVSPGSVTQTAGTITASGLRLSGSANFTLNQANQVSTVAGGVTGAVAFTDAIALTVGTVLGATGITTNNFAVTLTADNMTLTNAVNAGAAIATLAELTTGQLISLGGNDAAGTLGLSTADLNNVTAGILRVGDSASRSGNVTIVTALQPANRSTLSIWSGGSISQAGGTVLTVSALALRAVGPIALTEANAVSTVAANVSGLGNALQFTSASALTVGTVDGLFGVTTNNGPISLTANTGGLRVSGTPTISNVNAGTSTVLLQALGSGQTITTNAGTTITGTSGVTLVADNLALSGSINAGTATLALRTATPGATLNLGPNGLSNITAGVVRIGDANTGSINIPGPITLSVGLSLVTSGTITQSLGATLTVPRLALRAGGAVTLNEANQVGTLAASLTGSGAALQFTDATSLTVGIVDGLNGIATNNGNITLTVTNGGLTVQDTPVANDVNAGTSSAMLLDESANQTLSINSGANVNGTGGVTLVADQMGLAGTVTAGTAAVVVHPYTTAQHIDLGGPDASGTLGLNPTEVNHLNGGVVRIGDGNSSSMIISQPLTPTGTTTLSLQAGGSIAQASNDDTLTVLNLALQAAGPVTLNQSNTHFNQIGTLAAALTLPASPLQVTVVGPLIVGSVDGVNGVTTTNSAISLTTTTSGLTVTHTVTAGADVSAGTGSVILQALARDQVLTVASGASVSAVGGVTLIADQMALPGTVSAPTAAVVIHQSTAGQLINLGAASTGGTLGLAAGDVQNISGGILRVGDGNSGNLAVSAALTLTGVPTLSLQTGGSLSQGSSAAIAVGSLALQGNDVNMMASNNVVTLAAAESSSGNPFQFTNANGLTIGSVDGVTGINSNNGPITLITTTGLLRTTANVNAGTSTAALTSQGALQTLEIDAGTTITGTGGVSLSGDKITLDGSVAAAGATVTFAPVTANRPITLGGPDTASALGLTSAELNAVTANLLKVGSATSGNITVSTAIAISPAHAPTLSLTSSGTITQSAGATLTATNLALRAGGAITLTEANDAGTLGATTTTGDITYNDVNGLAIGSVDSLNGVTDTNGTVTLSVGGALTNGLAAGTAVTATKLVLTAGAGIATSAAPLSTAIANLEASGGSGGVFVTNTTSLTIGGIGPMVGVSATGGDIQLSAVGPLTVTENVATPGNITLTAAERTPPGAGDNLTINTGATVGGATTASVTLQAGDSVVVSAGATAQATGALTLTAGFNDNDGLGGITASGTLIGSPLILQGGPGDETFTVNGATTGPMTLNGQNGSDTYLISFGALGGPITINDTGPTGTDRAILTGTAAADSIAISATAVTWNGSETVNYAGLEALTVNGGDGNDTIQVTGSATGTPVTVDGQGGNNTYAVSFGSLAAPVTVSDSGGGTNPLTVNGTVGADTIAVTSSAVTWNGAETVTFAGVAALTVLGGAGNDQLNVASAPAFGVTLDGQGGSNAYQVQFGALAGSVTVSDSGGSGSNTLSVLGVSAANALTIMPGAVTWNGSETVNYAGIATLAVVGGAGNDAFQITGTSGGTALTFNGQGGSDTYQVALGSLGGPVSVNGTNADTLTVTGTPAGATLVVSASAVTWNGAETVNYQGVASLTVNAGDAADNIQVTGTAAGTATTVNGNGGNDTFTVSNNGLLTGLASVLTLDGGPGANSLMVNDTAATAPDVVALNAGSIRSAVVPFTINYGATGGSFQGITLLGGTGADTLNVQGAQLGPLMVDAGGGANVLNITEPNNSNGNTVFLTATGVTDSAAPFPLSYAATGGSVANLNLFTGAGNDMVYVESTPAGTTSVQTGAGDDNITVSSTPTLPAGLLNGLGGVLNLDAGAGSNRLVLSEAGRTSPDRVYFSANGIYSPAMRFPVFYKASGGTFAGGVAFAAGSGNDVLLVQGQQANAPLALYGGGGDDVFGVDVTTATNYSGVLLDGVGGNNALYVTDQSGGAVMQQFPSGPASGAIRVAYLNGSANALNYQNIGFVHNSEDAQSSFIQALYHTELDSNVTGDGLAYWLAVLNGPGGRAAVVQGIHDSDAARSLRVASWYTQYLGRPATPDGVAYWASLLIGHTDEEVLSTFLNSQEYFAKAGQSNQGFLQQLYQDLLGRTPGSSELQLWLTTLMPRAGRAGTALLVLTSPEYRTLTVRALYANLLHFTPADADVNYWVYGNLSIGQITVMIEESDAFYNGGG